MGASIINTGINTKIITANNINKVEVSTDNVIHSDSDFREVVKKGYLLSQINLSTVPDIIQDAINEAMLNTKEQTLADSLIETLRLSIENLDDGVYKKTYIDNTISYIENLVVSKVSPETVAAIADSKLALALQGFATTSSVQTLSSRVANSETEISNVKQTINTKDNARALQIEQMEVRVNDTFAGYSDAIDLYVDAQGNVKSQKIEKLEANNSVSSVSINEQNKISLDAQGNYVAFVAKFIADSNGKIVGYNFSDTNDLASFTINADVFKISNSDNSYTPFTIDGNNILFNGKMTFANVTGTDNLAYKDMSNVTTIDGGKIVTNQALVNNLNAVGGIIAETISANEIVGKTLTGTIINGAVINGAVVKASYLDLDGELEVLTNYHITPAMYSADPSLYTDAVYISGTNEWRIPSVSLLTEPVYNPKGTGGNYSFTTFGSTITLTAWQVGDIVYSKIKNYKCANAGHNMKIVKNSNITVNTVNVTSSLLTLQYAKYNCTHYSQYSNGSTVELYFDDLLILRCTYRDLRYSTSSASLSMASFNIEGAVNASGSVSTASGSTREYSYTFTFKGIPYTVFVNTGSLNVSISKGVYTIDSLNSSSGNLWKMKVIETFIQGSPVNALISFSSPAYMTINNMI